jgi:SIR2-like domain
MTGSSTPPPQTLPALPGELAEHLDFVSARLIAGKVIPFLGAGANLCGRPPTADWLSEHYLPTGGELAEYLASDYPTLRGDSRDLSRISQYVDLFGGGEAVLFEKLRGLFAGEYDPNALHHLLAAIPAALRARGSENPCQLIITTNYDDALERAFAAAGEPIDVVYYAAARGQPGRFLHVRPDGKRSAVPKTYRGFSLGERTVLLKIHGAVDRQDELEDSYVITEDHYLDYVARTNVYNLIPAALMARMSSSHFLFLGYAMRDWNLRVILHHIWSQQTRTFTSWAIEKKPDPIDEKFWDRHGVDIVAVRLEDWVEGMRARLL